MKSRPLFLSLIAFGLAVTGPILSLRHPDQFIELASQPISGLQLMLAWGLTVTGYGVWQAKRWAYYSFLLFTACILIVTFFVYQHSPTAEIYTTLLLGSLSAAGLAIYLNRELFSPWFNPRIEYASRGSRYIVFLDSVVQVDGRERNSHIIDISDGGCFVISETKLIPGESVGVTVMIEEVPFQINARVAWANTDLRGYGLSFTGFQQGSVMTLRKLLQNGKFKKKSMRQLQVA